MVFSFLRKKIKETINSIKKERIIKKVTEKKITGKEFNNFFNALELNLLQANIAYETIQAIKKSLEKELTGKQVSRRSHEKVIMNALKKALRKVLKECNSNELLTIIKESDKPVSFMFIGVNGSGKTTSIAKIANWLKKNKISSVMAACDTFRAASIEQLEKHGKALGIKVVKHKYGADAAAVAYDALEHARARNVKAVLIDTAGRSHANTNLMNELEKIKRVIKPDYTVFVGDALTGNDMIEQCRTFNNTTPFNFMILTKTDVDEKGGAILSASHTTGVPIMFLGTGQLHKDLKAFNKEELINQIIK